MGKGNSQIEVEPSIEGFPIIASSSLLNPHRRSCITIFVSQIDRQHFREVQRTLDWPSSDTLRRRWRCRFTRFLSQQKHIPRFDSIRLHSPYRSTSALQEEVDRSGMNAPLANLSDLSIVSPRRTTTDLQQGFQTILSLSYQLRTSREGEEEREEKLTSASSRAAKVSISISPEISRLNVLPSSVTTVRSMIRFWGLVASWRERKGGKVERSKWGRDGTIGEWLRVWSACVESWKVADQAIESLKWMEGSRTTNDSSISLRKRTTFHFPRSLSYSLREA